MGKEGLKISIITVCLNANETIEQTINSVLNQNYENKEYIIIDGGSTDGTLDIIDKYKDKIDYFISEPDYGLYHAMNKGIEKANGDIVGIVHADDYYYDNIFADIVKSFDGKDLEKYIFFGDVVYKEKIIKGWNEKNIDIGAFATHPSMFCPKKVYNNIGKYRLWYKILGCYDFTYRAFHKHNMKHIYLPKKISHFRDGGLASQNIFRSFNEEMIIKVESGEKIYKAFSIYILKLIRFSFKQILK